MLGRSGVNTEMGAVESRTVLRHDCVVVDCVSHISEQAVVVDGRLVGCGLLLNRGAVLSGLDLQSLKPALAQQTAEEVSAPRFDRTENRWASGFVLSHGVCRGECPAVHRSAQGLDRHAGISCHADLDLSSGVELLRFDVDLSDAAAFRQLPTAAEHPCTKVFHLQAPETALSSG